jgi:pantetheine-phosphate adenylyltransferase
MHTMIRALYPGTFDPIHNGHVDIASRAARLFDELVIGVYNAPPKTLLFETSHRVTLAENALRHLPNVRVIAYHGLTVLFAREIGASVMVRGLRAISDFELELQMAHTNKKIAADVEFICLMTSLRYAYLSSTIIKEMASLGGDVSGLVPDAVREALRARVDELGPADRGFVPLATSRD